MEKIFDRAMSGMKRSHIDALFLALEAVQILVIEKVKGSTVQWDLVWKDDNTPIYESDDSWWG